MGNTVFQIDIGDPLEAEAGIEFFEARLGRDADPLSPKLFEIYSMARFIMDLTHAHAAEASLVTKTLPIDASA